MTSAVGRLYVAAGALLAFFVLWAAVAAQPWAAAKPDARLEALQRREARITRGTAAALAAYEARLAAYWDAMAAARAIAVPVMAVPPLSAHVVSTSPVTSTRTS